MLMGCGTGVAVGTGVKVAVGSGVDVEVWVAGMGELVGRGVASAVAQAEKVKDKLASNNKVFFMMFSCQYLENRKRQSITASLKFSLGVYPTFVLPSCLLHGYDPEWYGSIRQ